MHLNDEELLSTLISVHLRVTTWEIALGQRRILFSDFPAEMLMKHKAALLTLSEHE